MAPDGLPDALLAMYAPRKAVDAPAENIPQKLKSCCFRSIIHSTNLILANY